MTLKITLLFVLSILLPLPLASQMTDLKYRTAIDSAERLHFITFYKDRTVRLNYAIGQGVYWDSIITKPEIFSYDLIDDTIRINTISGNLYRTSKINDRLIHAKFVIRLHDQLYDQNSGYTYVPNDQAKRITNTQVSIDNKIFSAGSLLLKHKMKNVDTTNYVVKLLRGKNAFDKYGMKGINGVIEIYKK